MSNRSQEDLLNELAREHARLADLNAQRHHARQRIAELRAEISAARVPGVPKSEATSPPVVREAAVPKTSSEKVLLFRNLFRGRLDVFPRRWVNNKKGSQGYAPACANEWVRGVCDKPRVKCGECPNQALLPVVDQVFLDLSLPRNRSRCSIPA